MIKILAVLAVLASGCSVALQPRPASKVVDGGCSTSRKYWIADAVGVGVSSAAAATGVALSLSDTSDGRKDIGRAIAGVGLVSALVYYASMDNGRKWSRECQPTALAHR